MNVSALWIRRPALTIVFSLIPAILGLFSLTRIEIRDLPRFDIPLIQIVTALPGGSAEQIASRITIPIEQAVATARSTVAWAADGPAPPSDANSRSPAAARFMPRTFRPTAMRRHART